MASIRVYEYSSMGEAMNDLNTVNNTFALSRKENTVTSTYCEVMIFDNSDKYYIIYDHFTSNLINKPYKEINF